MLIFVIFLHFGLKIMSLSASTTDTPSTHICADFVSSTNETIVKWAVSSQTPVVVSDCELIYLDEGSGNPVQVVYNRPSHGSSSLGALERLTAWTIRVTCTTDSGLSYPSPEIKFIPGDASAAHVCSDSGLGSAMPSDTDVPLVLCIWKPESDKNYAVMRWQPTSTTPTASTLCALHREVRGQIQEVPGLPIDDMQFDGLDSGSLSAWVTCSSRDKTFSSGKAIYTPGISTVCSVDFPPLASSTASPTALWASDGNPTDNPSQDAPTHGKLGISNMAMGLSLAAGILIGGVILSLGFIRWFRWQRRRRRERLLTHGEPATDQSAMDEFQQMM